MPTDNETDSKVHSQKHPQQDLSAFPFWEFLKIGSWSILIASPFLYWLNGASVSYDQSVARWILIGLALLGAIVSFAARPKKF